jgi:hypothetical protein
MRIVDDNLPAPGLAGTVRATNCRMAHRMFSDPEGVTWSVWDVHPQLAERRRAARRACPPMLAPDAREQRAGIDRRRRRETRVSVRDGYEQGWLAFDSVLGSRRLAPIPDHWEEFPDDRLVALCRQGVDAARARRRLIE